MLRADSPLTSLFGVSSARDKLFSKLGVRNLHGLVEHYPRGYEMRGNTKTVEELTVGEVQSCILTVGTQVISKRIPARGENRAMTVQRFSAYDGTGSVTCTFFNRNYLAQTLAVGSLIRVYGRVSGTPIRPEFSSPVFEAVRPGKDLDAIVPKYPLTAGLTDAIVISAVKQALPVFADPKFEVLSEEERKTLGLCTYHEALVNIHFPKSEAALAAARRRLAFDELYAFELGLVRLESRNRQEHGYALTSSDCAAFYPSLPFELTQGQMKAVEDIAADLRRGTPPMRRLLQGDVGCGKTAIAACAVFLCVKNEKQATLMAPTEILASQHFESLSPLMEKNGIRCALLTGSMTQAKKNAVRRDLANGTIDLLIGTHALLEDRVVFRDLALVITDEQHRFGVRQREKLENKVSLVDPSEAFSACSQQDDGSLSEYKPHMLVMSATPIPRTLAMLLFGDMEITSVRDMPPGRQKVDTYAVGEDYRERLEGFIEKQMRNGNQVYVVCPLIRDSEEADEAKREKNALKSVEKYAEQMQKRFPSYRVGFIHGKMKPAEKETIMGSFVAGETSLLISTTVIEVGVNVPNATLMVIENAERFGLSQLHQLRGRVGRGKDKAYCVLVSDTLTGQDKEQRKNNPQAVRLQILCQNSNGFEIAEQDLALRGPGEFFGERQHGELHFKIADMAADLDLIEQARRLAKKHQGAGSQ